MKKGIAAILLTFYFAFSSGIVINLHYCMNRFDSSKLGAGKSEICGKCGMHTDALNGCCHDEIKVIKIQDDQQVFAIGFRFTPQAGIAENVSFYISDILFGSNKDFTLSNHSPPLDKQDVYLVNCVFRI